MLERFHPIIASWFRDKFGAPTAPQALGWPAIAAGRDTLIAAPTGSGKTLAAFLACLDRLIREGSAVGAGPLPDATDILYISPLKALSNDVHRNLEAPLAEIRLAAATGGTRLPEIRVAVRTGDTPPAARDRMAKKPPHILVTTPESLYILLTSERGRRGLARVRTVVVDEIHAVAGDKRGAHLALSLARLDRLVAQTAGESGKPETRPVRVGLSATQRPIEVIARMLVGTGRPLPRIVDTGHARALDLAIEMTDDELGPIASNEQCGRVYDRIAELARAHETTLVFVNTRRLVERVAHQLEERLGEDQVVAHHGSLSRERRFAAEKRLKSGAVRCAVATASLELGIDVGSVDLVVQLGSPRAIRTLLQRIGRSGHSLGATPKGRLFALTRDQLVECAALVRAIRSGALDAIELRPAPLDVLAQQIVAACACEEIAEDDLYELCRAAAHYAELARRDFEAVLEMLAGGASARRGRAGARLHWDRVGRQVRARRGARLAAITCGGAIPDNANYAVVELPEQLNVGTLDEDFAVESMAGDVFLLGNTSWRIHRIESGRVLVENAHGAPPTIPFWVGEAPARTAELSGEVSELRRAIDDRLAGGDDPGDVSAWVCAECALPESGGEQLVAYLAAARAALGALPTQGRIIAERFFDEGGGMQLILHAPLGGRINKAWGLALRKRFCRGFNFELQAAATDDGIVISLGLPHSFPLEDVFRFLSAKTAVEVLVQAVLGAPLFGARWRWNATRSLAVLRRVGGKKVPPHILRMRTDDLLGAVFPMQQACQENVVGDIELPDHPLVAETMRDCTTEAMDADGLVRLLGDIEAGRIEVIARDTLEPSPLSHEILNANPYAYLDDAPLEERRTRAVRLPRAAADAARDGDIGVVDDAAVATAEAEAAPPIRDADEAHDALSTLYLWPARAAAPHERLLAELAARGRAARVAYAGTAAWVAAETWPLVRAAIPEATAETEPAPLPFRVDAPEPEAALAAIVRGHMELSGPRRADELAEFLSIAPDRIEAALIALEAEGLVLRGRFRRASRAGGGVEFCDRRMLARIHRLTLARLRKQIEPVTAAALMRFLLRWQRALPGYKLIGADGLRRVIEQMQGFETAAGAWERHLLPARVHHYDPAWLDALCLSGELVWGRLSPRRSNGDRGVNRAGDGDAGRDVDRDVDRGADRDGDRSGNRGGDGTAGGSSAPSRAAPLALMLRRDIYWLRAPSAGGGTGDALGALSAPARAVFDHLAGHGASFLAELTAAVGEHPAVIEDALWELVGAGLATADGFSSLRVLIDRRRGESRSLFDRARATAEPPRTRRWQEVVRRARARDAMRPRHALTSLPTAGGRWSLLGPPDPEATSAEASARQLLLRYGVVFRDLVARESSLPRWRDIAVALRRLEARGEIRGGRFVSGFVGEQFALAEALEGLRAVRRVPEGAAPEIVRVAATDPLNLVGVLSPGPRVPAVIGNAVLYRDGAPLASLEAGKVVLRGALAPGERIDDDLAYHGPRRHSAQTELPLGAQQNARP